jgi:adenine-specific DNA-methyltransferase
LFKKNLIILLDKINTIENRPKDESEEHLKNDLRDFLRDTYYKETNAINTKDKNDLVIHHGLSTNTDVSVIIEAKRPSNKREMFSAENQNCKALQELVLYFLRERISQNNLKITNLIISNVTNWYIFDGQLFDKLFAQNKKLVAQFKDFEEGKLSVTNTEHFYKKIAEPYIDSILDKLEYTYFDLATYDKILRNNDTVDDSKLIVLYKLLSPEHLLKLSFANDSNTLDKNFYNELLHLIGLTETKEGSKKLIQRPKVGQRHDGSLLENVINQLDSLDKLSRLPNVKQYGDTHEERLFTVGLELCITWVNRILFLKLLEAQLISYHKGDKSYAFLHSGLLHDYDNLNSLFFMVLAKKPDERNDRVKTLFAKVPYLNSSLFEPTELEHQTLFISGLEDDIQLPIISGTVLKDANGKKLTGTHKAIDYFFDFLEAYDFASEGSEEIQEDNKTLINASVLGLIFEKINGYKDGSFYTPSFITMYMCKETIRRAVVQKFNETKGWNCEDFEGLYNKIEDTKEANAIINSVKICDPAVGSGHFLVSALNEMIAIKHDLKVLTDRDGKRLKEYQVDIVNDELIVTDEDGVPFTYNPKNKESQRLQETLFHEKQTIIENCLFGVDINPNSVKICRLRLWIELLKNAYYRNESELETLPNIDINIKCGNSLISRFALDADLKKALKQSKWNIESYKLAVATYRNAESKEQKRDMEVLIADIKGNFRSEIATNDPKKLKLEKLKGQLFNQTQQVGLFELSKKEQTEWNKRTNTLATEVKILETEIEEIKSNKIYENAFEWRFEFPEVLNDDGDFVGFDVVIGNPPYMRIQEIQASQPLQKLFYESQYQNAKYAYDLANIFFELSVNISSNQSNNAYIFPHKFFNSASSEVFRNYLKQGQFIDEIAHFGANMIFEDADTYTCVAQFSKRASNGFYFQRFPFKSDFKALMLNKSDYTFITYEMIDKASQLYGNNQWVLFDDKLGFNVFEKIYTDAKLFSDSFEGIFQGIATSKDDLYIVECFEEKNFQIRVPISGKEYQLERDLFKPFLMGKDVQRFSHLSTNKYVFFPYEIKIGNAEVVPLEDIKIRFPKTYAYIIEHEKIFKARESGKAGKMQHWHAYIYPKNLSKFEQPKLSSMEICANHPNVTLNHDKLYHTTKAYSWVKKQETKESYEYLLAIANSKLLWWFLKITGDTLQGDARTFKTNYLNPYPLPKKLTDEFDAEISKKVIEVLSLKKDNPKADTTALEREIDLMVYELYGLTQEEIEIVENC